MGREPYMKTLQQGNAEDLRINGRVEMSGTPEQVITPQIIKKIFEVDAEVYKDETGTVRVIFHSNSTRA